MECEEQVVVKVVRLVALPVDRDAVDVQAGQGGLRRIGSQDGAGLFDHLAAAGGADIGVFGFDVAAREQPAVQAAVMDQQQPLAPGAKDQAATGDVAGAELVARERSRGAFEQQKDEFAALEGRAIRGIGKGTDEGGNGWGSIIKRKSPRD